VSPPFDFEDLTSDTEEGIVKKGRQVLRLLTQTELRDNWKLAVVAGSHMGSGLHTRHLPPRDYLCRNNG
jgi:hypothetical protein